MKQKLLIALALLATTFTFSQTFTWNPEFFEANESATLTISNFDPQSEWGVDDIYLWAWHFDADGEFSGNPDATGSDFGNSPETAKFTDNGNGTYTYDFGVIQDFFSDPGITTIGFLIKSQDGSNQSGDNLKNVGVVRVNVTSPDSDFILIDSGDDVQIVATIEFEGNTTVAGSFELYFDDGNSQTLVDSGTCGFPNCVADATNITESGILRFVGTPPGETLTAEASFEVFIVPTVIEEALPAGVVDGVNYGNDNTRATLVVSAPGKDFVQVAASWNNYIPGNDDVMKRDPSTGKFWLEITGLTANKVETYQYWVFDATPVTDSPVLVKTADPFSTLVLSPFDDPFIPDSSFPNIPDYPEGQEREVTILETGQTPYDWQVTDFEKPKKEDLIVYEVLVRDFDANRNYQDLIDRIDYFKNLNINAIHLMPVMEFEGNESWGYNTSFHMALDKFYGTPDKLKEFIDLCHQNGIAIILDVVLNHAFGRNPMVRMWMDDPDGDGWGRPSTDNPYLNVFPTHSFNVGNDFNHQEDLTQEYTRRVIKHWIEEYKIDGFRWDLTKGFTQNCGDGTDGGDFNCTQLYQQDRIDVLREYADYSWSLDDTHYVIFEHLGSDNEEQQWANYRIDEGKGIMMWGKMTDPYNELTMGQNGNKDISRMGHESHGFTGPRVLGYPESHDEERLMFKNTEFGNSSNPSHDVKDLNTALSRMSALGAVSVLVPGPKMIWHFGDLGMNNSIFTCSDGSYNNDGCKLDTKPQPQWVENWLSDAMRRQIYDDWAKLHALKVGEDVFEGDYTITTSSGSYTPRIDIFDTSKPNTELRNVIVLSNFDVNEVTVNTNFPGGVTDTWYDLMDPTGNTTISNSTASVTLQPGQFWVLGNVPSEALSTDDNEFNSVALYPNPTSTTFKLNVLVEQVEVYDLSGKQIRKFKGNFQANQDFDVTNLNAGIYMLRIINSEGQMMTSKLVKL